MKFSNHKLTNILKKPMSYFSLETCLSIRTMQKARDVDSNWTLYWTLSKINIQQDYYILRNVLCSLDCVNLKLLWALELSFIVSVFIFLWI